MGQNPDPKPKEELGGWDRFEHTVDVALHAKPEHRESKASRDGKEGAKPTPKHRK
jgi:hypothetical protein